ncbi:MAG: hypothetical protein K0S55_1127 [Clostridia bacterium]|nr:hypothetical protein [Clostridia bacterium]
MIENHLNHDSYLDQIRLRDGVDRCRDVLYQVWRNNRRRTAALLNDPEMTFPCLFILLPQIKSLRLYYLLNNRNRIAAGIVGQIVNARASGTDYLLYENRTVHSVLRWMLETSGDEENLDDDFRQVLDIVVSVLINTYQDKNVLPNVDELIFRRHKAGRNIHNLVWSLFRIKDPDVLKLVAEHMRSSDPEESEFACCLLNIKASKQTEENTDNQKLYEDYLRWFEENKPFLYFTGECFQSNSEPVVCRIDQNKKAAFSQKEEMP